MKENFIRMGNMFCCPMKNWTGSVIPGNGSAAVPQWYNMQLSPYLLHHPNYYTHARHLT